LPVRPYVIEGIGDGKAAAPCARLLTPLHLWRSADVLDAGDLVELATRASELLTRC
jgi:hypothetical protein